MALYHLSVKTVSRSSGRSAVAAAAYRTGARLTNERDGQTHDFTRRSGVVLSFVVAPAGAEAWTSDRSMLWNTAEQAETRKNSTVAREYELALPAELDAAGRAQLARDFAEAVVQRFGVVADVAIHAPGRDGDNRNHHAHVLTTTRVVDGQGFGAKTRALDDQKSGAIAEIRALWGDQVNQALERAGREERVDHRSFERRGVDQVPELHLGPAASAMERREQQQAQQEGRAPEPQTTIAQQNAEISATNTERAGLRQQLVETVRGWAEALRDGWNRVQERLGAAQERQEREEATKRAQERQEVSRRSQEAAKREALRQELRQLRPEQIEAAANSALVRDQISFYPRAMTVEDAAHRLFPAYAAAVEQMAKLGSEIGHADKSITQYAKTRDYHQTQSDQRFNALGKGLGFAQLGHRIGLRRDPQITQDENSAKFAADNLAEQEKRRSDLLDALGRVEKVAAAEWEKAKPVAEAHLAALQERSEVAKEVLAERREASLARARERPRERGRDRDRDRDRDEDRGQDLGR